MVNEQLYRLRGYADDFGGIPIIVFCGDFRHQVIAWTDDTAFRNKFTTVVILDEQVRAAGDPRLQQLLRRIRHGVQDQSDMDFLNDTCYQEGRRIPWESGITVITPLNRNRWNLNVEATLSFQRQRQSKDGQPTEEEALMLLSQGDDSAIPVPAIFIFVQGMPITVNQNTHQGLKLVNGARYTALDVILDLKFPGHRVNADTMLHFGPPAGIVLASETTRDYDFVGMPAGTILLVPRPWQMHDVSRRGLPCAAAIMLLSRARERDIIGNRVPETIVAAENRLERLSEGMIQDAERWDWSTEEGWTVH
ncbi:hypothetical protein P152DRAFT_460946 [Eremomyces bilateralis CBS 781.70]|uniref:Uncharacterized protein n=1 Tax=Eremomyces bilateralis CBS 781.70 TaxID=1392243 RepID=A0A6G1FVJ6_9PEZI|nr:uncharacterized protein P152DRAFT_460946 [Eremomyces bilateralis CBS 781.70]KAF1809847.1 hypothetical protein P152DRAFT_460946 [Eremomyces bilateralis CBS 781.70]